MSTHDEPHRRYSDLEEILHALTHGAGIPLALAGLVLVTARAAEAHGGAAVAAAAIYGVSLVLLYAASAAYHAAWRSPWQGALRRLDHAAIFLMIAGTYTPVALMALPPGIAWAMLGSVWTIAALGIGAKVAGIFWPRTELGWRASLALYLAMGWIGALGAVPLWAGLGPEGFAWLMAGGLCFTAGAAVYAMHFYAYAHVVWHLFVLAGSAAHFVLVWRVLGEG